MNRALVLFAIAIVTVAACSLLYDPGHLAPAGSAIPDGDLGRGASDAASDPDAAMPGDDALASDALQHDAATADAAQHDAAVHDAATDAAIDAARPDAATDASIDAARPDASPPDAPSCGGTDQPCCAGPNPCEEWNECTGGACRECGALLESCCDPGASCQFGACLLGVCT